MKKIIALILILAAAWALLYGISGSREPAPDRPFFLSLPARRPLVIAHRGGGEIFPENTLHAFRESVRLGADLLEMDIYRTTDGVPVAIHDETVNRTTEGAGPVGGFTLEELKELDAGYRFSPPDSPGKFPYRGRGLTVPALREVFAELPETRMIVEIKEDDLGLVDRVVELIREFGREEITLAASFHHGVLARFRETAPEIATHAAEGEAARFLIAARLGLEGLVTPDYGAFLIPHRRGPLTVASRRFIRAARNRNLFVGVWTVNDPGEMRTLIDRGVDGLVTGRPDLALEIIGPAAPALP